jgi:Fe2+ or Zn2+ uptake regulation protein
MNIVQELQSRGLKATGARIDILRFFLDAKPVSAAELHNALKLDKVTVYRNLETLLGAGLIKKVELGGRAAKYELDRGDDHHHITCLKCHRIEAVHHCPVSDIESRLLATSRHFIKIASHSLEFQGICSECSH